MADFIPFTSKSYNTLIKIYPGGKVQYRFYPRSFDVSDKFKPDKVDSSDDSVDPDDPTFVESYKSFRSAYNSLKRTIQKVYDIAQSNSWDYFCTLTFDPLKVRDRYDYSCCCECVHRFTDLLRYYHVLYLFVPEQHKDGAWHFHGLLSSCSCLPISFNRHGYATIDVYRYGFVSLIPIVGDSTKISTYITKYFLKDLRIPPGKKRYWASRGLNKPLEIQTNTSFSDMDSIISDSRYVKTCYANFSGEKYVSCIIAES